MEHRRLSKPGSRFGRGGHLQLDCLGAPISRQASVSALESNVQLHDAKSRRGVHHAVVENLALARFGGLAVVCMSKSRLPQIHQPGWA